MEVSLWLSENNEHTFTQKSFFCTIKKLFKVLPIFDLFGAGQKKSFSGTLFLGVLFCHWKDLYCFACLKVITRLNDRISQQKCSKTQNFICSNFVQKWIKITFRSQRSPEKSFLVISGQFWTKIKFWKKKVPKFCPNNPKMGYFWNFNCGFLVRIGRYVTRRSA